jgi:hypothetical protein
VSPVTATRQDTWAGCYAEGWQGLIVPEAFAHPAKFARALIQRIYQHLMAEDWLHPGDTVLDPFGGVALGGLDAGLAGMRWLGVELEPRFHTLGQANIALWQRRYGHLPQWITPTLVQGDSRQLQAVLREQVGCCVSSPPYSHGLGKEHTYADHTKREDDSHRGIMQEKGIVDPYYGNDPAQLGNMPAGTLTAAIASPPYADSTTVDSRAITDAKTHTRPLGAMQHLQHGYRQTPGQLGTEHGATFWTAAHQIVAQVVALLKPGGVAIWVVKNYVRDKQLVDFPGDCRRLCESLGLRTLHEHHAFLAEQHGTQGGLFGEDTQYQTARKSFFRRLAEAKGSPAIDYEVVYCMVKDNPGFGRGIDAIVVSPPYVQSVHAGNGIDHSKLTGNRPGRHTQAKVEGYGTSPGQLGAMPAGVTPR